MIRSSSEKCSVRPMKIRAVEQFGLVARRGRGTPVEKRRVEKGRSCWSCGGREENRMRVGA